jgi:hypothetical protein
MLPRITSISSSLRARIDLNNPLGWRGRLCEDPMATPMPDAHHPTDFFLPTGRLFVRQGELNSFDLSNLIVLNLEKLGDLNIERPLG